MGHVVHLPSCGACRDGIPQTHWWTPVVTDAVKRKSPIRTFWSVRLWMQLIDANRLNGTWLQWSLRQKMRQNVQSGLENGPWMEATVYKPAAQQREAEAHQHRAWCSSIQTCLPIRRWGHRWPVQPLEPRWVEIPMGKVTRTE